MLKISLYFVLGRPGLGGLKGETGIGYPGPPGPPGSGLGSSTRPGRSFTCV